MLTPKADFLGTGPILYVCEIVFGLQETPTFCHNLSCMFLTIHATLSIKAMVGSDLSAAHFDQITSVVEYRVCKSKPCRP